jgi:uncharacterized protein GlcG (DUF336 family)
MFLALCAALLLGLPAFATQSLTPADVEGVIARVVQEARARHVAATIAVVDRMGGVLAVYQMSAALDPVPVLDNPYGPNVGLPDSLTGVYLPPTGISKAFPKGFAGVLPAGAVAIAKAITGAYLSSSHGNAFTTRTASQIIQNHFNPGTLNTPSGPLYGVQFSSLPCSDLNVRLDVFDYWTGTEGPHRSPLGLSADPGGFPLYKDGDLVGGVGVKAVGAYGLDLSAQDDTVPVDEALALAGTITLDAPTEIRANEITVGGLLLRYSNAVPSDLIANPYAAPPYSSLPFGLKEVPGYYYGSINDTILPGVVYGTPPAGLAPDTSGLINPTHPPLILMTKSQPRYPPTAGAGLSLAEVLQILRSAYAVVLDTRAQIRNPPGSAAAITISVVDIYGKVLGIVTTPDAPNFGIDVSLQKARTAAFLSNPAAGALLNADPPPPPSPYFNPEPPALKFNAAATSFFHAPVFSQSHAWSARAVGTISRNSYPDGIGGSPNGPFSFPASLTTPFSDGLQLNLIAYDLFVHLAWIADQQTSPDVPPYCTSLSAVGSEIYPQPVLADGLQIFPGGFPIYRGNTLVGGIGASGDGVDQDDLASFLGLYNAGVILRTGIGEAPQGIRANLLSAYGISPRYVNCPYAPFLNGSGTDICDGK